LKFYVNPYSNAKQTADSWRSTRADDAYQMDKIANSPEAVWLGGWSGDIKSAVANKISAAKSQGAVPVFIAYNIPNRDCGSYSSGGVSDASSYQSWIQNIAQGIGGSKAVVVLEPDAVASTDCLSQQQKNDRYSMLSNAVSTLKNAGALVYLDAGHPNWISADEMSSRLNSAGISKADGFAVNVSNFYSTSDNMSYGSQISSKVGGKHFVIDTARNGLGATADNQWCNPGGRALGARNTTSTGNALVDAFLWLKNPGESDGNCNGGPSAGTWWPDYALGLAKRSAL
jgi:endoglucanase